MLLLVFALAVPAVAATTDAVVVHQAWASTGYPPQAATDDDELYASALLGRERSRTLLQLNLSSVPQAELYGSAIDLVAARSAVPDDEHVLLVACLLAEPLREDGELSGGDPPAEDCTVQAPVERVGTGGWSIPMDVFAARVHDGQLGLAVRPEVDAGTTTFEIAFDTSKTAFRRAEAASTPPSPAPADEKPPPAAGEASGDVDPGAGSQAGGSPDTVLPALPPIAAPDVALGTVPPPDAAPAGTLAPVLPSVVPRAAASSVGSSTTGWLALLAACAVFGGGLLLRRRIRAALGEVSPGGSAGGPGTALPAAAATFVALTGLGLLGGEAFAFKLGVVAIIFIAAIGLHILVNTTGELSLAHAALVGLPAFVVAQVSVRADVSPIYLLPLGLVVGALLGALVGLPALRTRGLQVALVTLAVAFAIERYLFRQAWLIGPPSGLVIPQPTLLGLGFDSNRELLPVMAAVVALAVLAASVLLRSRIGRALSFVRSSPDAAAAVGVPIAQYRLLAFGIAGAFAGLAASLYVVWVQQVSAPAFSITQSFFYLVVVVLAGRGGLGGLALSAGLLTGGQLLLADIGTFFDYAGPLALIANLALYRKGLNGALRDLSQKRQARRDRSARRPAMDQERPTVRLAVPSLGLIIGASLIAAGFVAIALAWYHTGNTSSAFVHNQELISGGIGGLALIITGATLLLRDAQLNGRTVAAAATTVKTAPDREVVAPDDLRDLEDASPDRPVTARPRARSRATT
jgi:branched-chain amino acid transport system permease protein